jgi:hypothetical protein
VPKLLDPKGEFVLGTLVEVVPVALFAEAAVTSKRIRRVGLSETRLPALWTWHPTQTTFSSRRHKSK